MNKVMFEVMRYFGLNHRLSSAVKWKLNELRGIFTLESQINTVYTSIYIRILFEFTSQLKVVKLTKLISPDDFWNLFHMPDVFLRVPLQKNTCNVFQYYSLCCSFSTVRPLWSSGKTLAANAWGHRFESHRGHNILFFTFYSIRVKCEEFCCVKLI